MMPLMEAVTALEAQGDTPPLAAARMRRQLTVEAAAKLARLTPDEVTWLEEGRLYRFPSSDSALLALLLYSTGLGIGRREARRLAGLPIFTRPGREQMRQVAGMLVGAVVLVAAAGAFVLPGLRARSEHKPSRQQSKPGLPPTWKVSVDVLNGSGDMNYTRSVASKIGALAYRIDRVARADRFDYPETAVYFHTRRRATRREARPPARRRRPAAPRRGKAQRLVVVVGPARTLELEPELGEALLERRRHRLDDGLPHETAEALFELVALPAVLALRRGAPRPPAAPRRSGHGRGKAGALLRTTRKDRSAVIATPPPFPPAPS